MIATLTSLRFIFAMMVFGAHCYVIDSFFDTHVFKEGFVGVSFFFVLSGFIIAYNYQKKLQDNEISRRTFWVARAARVYPLHWLTLCIAAVLGNYVVASGGWDWIKHFLASLTLTHAYIPRADYFFSFNSPSWSLCCEQLFYISFPFLIPLTKNHKHLWGIMGVMTVLLLAGMYFTPEDRIKEYWYINPITRFPDFIVGILLFQLYERVKDKRISLQQGTMLEIAAIVFLWLSIFMPRKSPKYIGIPVITGCPSQRLFSFFHYSGVTFPVFYPVVCWS